MSLDRETWFTEQCDEGGTAFSLKIKRRLHSEQSKYQKIEVYDTERFGKLLVIDDFVMLSSRDNFVYHEMIAHPALFTHPSPRNVLVVGGGDCGTLREVLRHDTVTRAVLVDIDERVTRVSEQYFPELCESNHDPRAELLFDDGIRFVRQSGAKSFDVIIVDSTDPVGPGEVLFTEEFYSNCHRILGDHGLLVQQSESPLYHLESIIKPMYRHMRAAGFHDVRSLQFPQPVYPSGWWTCTMACRDRTISGFREASAAAKRFETVYYNAAVHSAAMAMPEFVHKALVNA